MSLSADARLQFVRGGLRKICSFFNTKKLKNFRFGLDLSPQSLLLKISDSLIKNSIYYNIPGRVPKNNARADKAPPAHN